MTARVVTLGFLLLVLAGCGGEVGTAPVEMITYHFVAVAQINPTQPTLNKRVNINLEVTSSSTREVKTDIDLKVVSLEGEKMYSTTWDQVLFHEHEVWNLTQGFLPDSDANRKPWTLQITVKDHVTGDVLYDQGVAKLDFNH